MRGPRNSDGHTTSGPPRLGEDEAGPGSRRFWPTSGTPEPDPVEDVLAPDSDQVSRFDAVPAPDRADRRGRSVFRRLVAAEEAGVPGTPAPGGAVPTDVRLASLGRAGSDAGTDDPGEPADQGGDPELDIDQDLDRAADTAEEPEQSRALDLPGLGLPDEGLLGLSAGHDGDLSGPFDAVEGADGTGTFSGLFADASLDDADETGFVPVTEVAAGTGWAESADPRYGDRVEGWIRPEYPDEPEAVAGEYWTPVPEGSYETEYGWPTPVERLPEVPPYPPSSGFDVPAEIEAEPTRPVPQWPPARPDDRIELPRSWSHRGGETGPAFRTAVDRDKPVVLRPATNLPIEDAAPDRLAADPAGVLAAAGDVTAGGHPPEAAYPTEGGHAAGHPDESRAAYPAEDVYPAEEVPTGRRRFDEPTPAPDDRVFLGNDGLTLAPNPYADDETAQPGHTSGAQAARRLAATPPAHPADRRTGRTRRDTGPQEAGHLNDARDRRANRPAPGAWPPPAPHTDPPQRPRNSSAQPAGGNAASRVPARRGPATGQSGPYAESLEGPIWTVPDLPEAAMPDLTWSPEEASDARRQRRPAVMVRRRRGAAPAAGPGADATQALPPMEPARPDQPRARPRPRPRPGNGQPEPRSTVYVSRHAAEPS
ncbi:hypothetical protein [Actinoplanes auranticolor]|uniref:hypothetical protein n=1 Tax=Actinoplanes auranticolor TaxID=47988 RepID=UPI001BB435F1|nr:hypothetical protein [Actinoplanes auranticolor]